MELRLGARVGVEADGTVVEKVWIRFDVTGAVTDDEHNDQHKKKKVLHFLLHYEIDVTKCNRKNLTSKMTPIFQTDQELFMLDFVHFEDNTISYCFTLLLCGGPCHLSRSKQCSGNLIFLFNVFGYLSRCQ